MRELNKVFHLAIPCKNLDETKEFYEKLGSRMARRYEDRITFNFFGDQVVCHLHPEGVNPSPAMYPRHFGVTFVDRKEFDDTLRNASDEDLPFFQKPLVRFEGRPEEHLTFFLIDPSNNLLEFKWYPNISMIY